MKKSITLILILFSLYSCSTYNYSEFYKAHKNDMNTTAFQMPKFLTNVLSGLSPEINSFFNNVHDFKFLTFNNVSPQKLSVINEKVNLITNSSFTDFIRKNEENTRLVISGKEKKGIVKELVYYYYKNNRIHSFYLKGNFDSNKIKSLSEKKEFEKFSQELLTKANVPITPISIQ